MTDRLPVLKDLLRGWTNRDDERQIIDLLRSASSVELNALLAAVDVDDLFNDVDNHVLGPDHLTELVNLLAVERRNDLTIENQASVIYGMQKGRTSDWMQEAICGLFLALHGEDLTRLKNRINMRTDHHDLEGLMFGDISNEPIRERILRHIQHEAATVPRDECKILSDIDDTFRCRLFDERYPKRTIYPGILPLYEALDAGPDDTPFSTGDLTFVTARPMDSLGVIENHSRRTLRKAGVTTSSVMAGSFMHLLGNKAIAAKKQENIDHYHQLFPEYPFVFIGDSGQGDILVGRHLIEEYGDHMQAVFIHDVVGMPPEERERLHDERIDVVDTYLGAAILAWERQLISRRHLDVIVDEARESLAAIEWDSDAQRDLTSALFTRDEQRLPDRDQ